MNVLCHLVLGAGCPHQTLGQFLGDFTRGAVDALPYRPAVKSGIRAHRAADAFSDRHPFTRNAKSLLPPAQRRYGGLVLDVYCDTLLHQCWDELVPTPKADFIQSAYAMLAAPAEALPERARHFANLVLRHRLLDAYADPAEIQDVLWRMGQRLRRPVDLSALLPAYLAAEADLRQQFPAFFRDTVNAIAAAPHQSPIRFPASPPSRVSSSKSSFERSQ